ncbi:hypothetical protein IEN85_10870 [Pelagicoccus sp. NFK12]|uniref:PH domain-containing protein n=1 Tax=Pelagicoccus enzymogenes TaxID=2773457 RepID=A0A927FA32_9BACT|nr:hypothetical protein [Pelagicoccus enzymogenes]MBD5779991.1 hypothetical protein [Pelagicoccus enzymogenes]
MEIKGKALNRIDRVLLMLGVLMGLALFGVLVPPFFRDPDPLLASLFFLPLFTLSLGMAYVGVLSQFCWVSVSGEKVIYKGMIKESEYEWNEIEKTEFPVHLGTTTPHALFHLKTGKKKYVPCGDPEIRKLLSTHVIEKMINDNLAEQDGAANGR